MIKGSNPSPFVIAYNLRRKGRKFSRGIHKSVSLCGTGVGTVRTYESEEGPRSTIAARHNCHSAWACPVCSPKLAAARQKVLAPQIVRLMEDGYSASLVTLTLKHQRGDDLKFMFEAMGRAWGRLASGKGWKNWRCVGDLSVQYIKGLDLTWSLRNGWHPHIHVALYLPPGHSGDVEWFIQRWIKCLEAEGFIALREAQDAGKLITVDSVKEAQSIGAYAGMTAAMPTAEAISMALKRSRSEGSFTPFEILAKAVAGEWSFERLWKQYVEATKGLRQVTVSRGLKLSADADLSIADDVATIGPEARTEIEKANLIPAILSAARCADQDERRVSVSSVLSRLEAKDWRIIEPGERQEVPIRETAARRTVQKNKPVKLRMVWRVNVFARTWAPAKRIWNKGVGGWSFPPTPFVPMDTAALHNIPREAFDDVCPMVGLTTEGLWVWAGRGRAKSRMPPARSFRPLWGG